MIYDNTCPDLTSDKTQAINKMESKLTPAIGLMFAVFLLAVKCVPANEVTVSPADQMIINSKKDVTHGESSTNQQY